MRDGERAAAQFGAMAAEYSEANDRSIFNSLYERPAMLDLLGTLQGQRVLDLGCGAGQLSESLVAAGAAVVGLDVSPAMVDLAANRLGNAASFVVGDLAEPLRFDADSFDVVVASLVLHYLEHWTPTLEDIRRVMTPGGSLTFSIHHPTMDWELSGRTDYFAKTQLTQTWTKGGRPFDVTFWRRSLAAISAEIHAAGFLVERLEEPMPADALAQVDANADRRLRSRPHFLFIRARAVNP